MDIIKDLLTSKKFVTAVTASIAAGLLRIGLDIPAEDLMLVLGPVIAYIVGQGISDVGKGAAVANGKNAIASMNVLSSK